jgi:hypothetical protein
MFSGRERYTKCVYNIIDEVQDTRNNKKNTQNFSWIFEILSLQYSYNCFFSLLFRFFSYDVLKM